MADRRAHRQALGALQDDALRVLEGVPGEPGQPVRATLASRFFAGAIADEVPQVLRDRLPDAYQKLQDAADAICEKRFDLLGHTGLSFGDPPDWCLDPRTARRAPLVHWSRLDPLDADAVGDAKLIWELNRHQWFVRLGQAYRLTGDERYAEACATALSDWLNKNPNGVGINWSSSLEVAFRVIAWSWALVLLRNSKALTSALLARALSAVDAHAAHLEKYLSYYFSPNTHLTGEALGLFYTGVLFPEFGGARRRRDRGLRILVDQTARQICDDGVYFEQSTCYQRYTVEIYLHLLVLAQRHGIAVPPIVRDRLEQMVDFLAAIQFPDGSMPQIGDDDGGWLLSLAPRAASDCRGVLAVAAAFFSRPDFAWAAGGVAPEVLWLLGPEGLRAFDVLQAKPAQHPPSRLFRAGGYAVMRSDWAADAHYAIVDVGPLGCPITGAHGHADLLSVQCVAFGKPYLVDAGTYCYTSEPEWRDFFRSSAAHSTVLVDGVSQAIPAGPFAWQARPSARLREWQSTPDFDFVDAEHDAYRRLPDPVHHRRRVLFVKPRYWIIIDDLEGSAPHRVDLRFQLGPDVCVDSTSWTLLTFQGGPGLAIRPFASVPLGLEIIQGREAPIQGWVSADYGRRCPAPTLIYSTRAKLPLRIASLLVPLRDPAASPPAVSAIVDNEQRPIGLFFADTCEHVHFGDQIPVLKGDFSSGTTRN